MNLPRKAIIISLAVLIILIASVLTLRKYLAPLQKETFIKYQNEYVNRSFYGTIDSIYRYPTNEHVIDIIIKDTSGEKIIYNRLSFSFQPLLVSYIAKGDSILKKTADESVTVFKKDGDYKTFVLY